MENNIYQDIATRTGGDIYIGVVGPVRTGKSTYIKQFMEKIVIPKISNKNNKKRSIDELPQSSAGKTIMTTEPKFIPEEAIEIELQYNVKLKVRLIDCVGYIVPSSEGYIENESPRMIRTPWFNKEIPFNMAAEIGTKKVINEHSTIGLVITTDGSITGIPREEYAEAEERVINELKDINKPFVVILNCKNPESKSAKEIAESIRKEHNVDVITLNCLELDENDVKMTFKKILGNFPISQIDIKMPKWINMLDANHWLKEDIYNHIRCAFNKKIVINDISNLTCELEKSDNINVAKNVDIDLATGKVNIAIELKDDLLYTIICEETGIKIDDETELISTLIEFFKIKEKYEKFEAAINEVEETGYGIVVPQDNELTLESPKVIKQGKKYGVNLKATASSIHMIKAEINTEINPIVGSKEQSKELTTYLLNDFAEDPQKIWKSNIFGKSLKELVNEGLNNKLHRLPPDSRVTLQDTIERIINEDSRGLICILL